MAPIIEITTEVLKGLNQLKIPYILKKENLEKTASIFNKDAFIYVPSINLYVAKERTHLNKNWKDCWTELKNQNYQMLKINEFREFLKYTKENHKDIYDEITEVRNPWRAEWLDANFKVENKGLFKKGKLYILTENESKKEKLNVKK